MIAPDLEKLKYPIGKMPIYSGFNLSQIKEFISGIKEQPAALGKLVRQVKPEEENFRYRPGSWTIRQIVHHIADSHINAYIRTKLALSEVNPTIKPYDENEWAKMEDTRTLPLPVSVDLLNLLTQRWICILENLNEEQLEKTYFHPASQQTVSIKKMLSMYHWHGNHHIAQIKQALELKITE